MRNWFNLPTTHGNAQLQQEVLTLRRVLMSDIASLGQDVREHGVQLEELTEAVKILTDGQTSVPVNTLAEDKMLAQVSNGASVNTLKPSTTRRKTPARKGA